MRYKFGKNWKKYLETTESSFENNIDDAKNYLKKIFNNIDFKKSNFFDVGSGSGLFSLAAAKLGAKSIISIDFDKDSVEATNQLKKKYYPSKKEWQIFQSDILDKTQLVSFKTFDIVHCAGVVHHTGNMHLAISNLKSKLDENGIIFISVYNKIAGISKFWRVIKIVYNKLGVFNFLISYPYILAWILYWLLQGKNPVKIIKSFGSGQRGMAFFSDIDDWLGGYPYEYATCGEIFQLFPRNEGYTLIHLESSTNWGLNNFVFQKKTTTNVE